MILYGVVRFALHVHAEHPVAMLGFMILASCAFIAVAQAISALLGPVLGKVLLMTLLMLQLVSAGGLYPVETTTKPFQSLHRLDPMTYGVNGLRQLILGGIDGRLWQALIFMVALWLGVDAADLAGGPAQPVVEPHPAGADGQDVMRTKRARPFGLARLVVELPGIEPGPTAFPQGFSVRSPPRLYSDLLIMRTSQDDDPSRCLMSPPRVPRPNPWVGPSR